MQNEKLESELDRRVVVEDCKRALKMLTDMLETDVLKEVDAHRHTLHEMYAYIKIYLPQVV